MFIPIIISVRGVILASVIVLGLGIFVIVNNSKDKAEYDKHTGTVEYLAKEYQNLPIRHKGEYRYLKIDTYPYVFEIYEPNSKPTDKRIDDLKVGDTIDIYCYETTNTQNEGLNRFTQFIDKDEQPYFVRSAFQKQLGFVLVGLCFLMNIMALLFWKKKMLEW
ncbi:MAG TPA: hypothetical protein VGD89_09885 [Flavipsychrobacter sp.]